MGASAKKALWWWLLLLPVFYAAGCGAFIAAGRFADAAAAKESDRLLAKLKDGMTPAEVERVIGRPSEHTVRYARMGDDETFSHNWTVNGCRLEVIFLNGSSTQRNTFRPVPGPVRQFFGRVFFWWLEPFVGD